MHRNYSAWEIEINDFHLLKSENERLLFLLKFAVLAPSSHNSQPWEFSVRGKKIILSANLNRSLPKSDPNHRQLIISLGCVLENLLVSAHYFGYDTIVDYLDEENKPIRAQVIFNFTREQSRDPDHLFLSITSRSTNRNGYDTRMPDWTFLSSTIRAAEDLGIAVTVVSDAVRKKKISELVVAATATAMGNLDFRNELSNYLKSNFTSSPLGMPGFGFGLPDPVSMFFPMLVRVINVGKLTKKRDEDLLINHTPAFIVISSSDSRLNWIRVGQIYERIALLSEKNGMRTAPLASVIQIDEYYKNLKEVIGTNLRPQFFFRIGYCSKIVRHSPRLSSNDVMAASG